MKTVSSRNQYQEREVAGILDSLIFGYLQRKQYAKTLHALLSESSWLTKDATSVPGAPNQIFLNVNCFLHDKNLEEIIEIFYTYGRFDLPPSLIDLGKRLRELSNEFSTELAFGCHSYSGNEQRMYGRKLRTRHKMDSALIVDRSALNVQPIVNTIPVFVAQAESSHQPMDQVVHGIPQDLPYAHPCESNEEAVMESSSNENGHHSRRKAAHPLKRGKRVAEQLAHISNEKKNEKEAGIENSWNIDDNAMLLGIDNIEDVLKNIVDNETLFQTLENEEREEMEADMNSRDSHHQSGGVAGVDLSLDIPMHDDVSLHPPSLHPPPLISPLPSSRRPYLQQPPTFSTHFSPAAVPVNTPSPMLQGSLRSFTEQPSQLAHFPTTSTPKETRFANVPSGPPPLFYHGSSFSNEQTEQQQMKTREMERRGRDAREIPSPSQSKGRSTSIHVPPPSQSTLPPAQSSLHTLPPYTPIPKMSHFGRIPKKGSAVAAAAAAAPAAVSLASPSSSPKQNMPLPGSSNLSPRGNGGIRLSKRKIAPLMNEERRESMESQETIHAESVGESDCTMTETEDIEVPVKRKEREKETKGKNDTKASWDDLFEDAPLTVEESNREKKRQKEALENKRRLEMKELEKKREREKRRKEKDRKEDGKEDEKRRDRSKDERDRQHNRCDDRRRDSIGRDDREEKERDEKMRKIEKMRKEQEEQKRIIEGAKRVREIEERVLQKKKEEEDRKREQKEQERRREREKEEERRRELKKIEDEKIKKEREAKAKEERRIEMERRKRKESLAKKNNERFLPSLLDPLDKISAEMEGRDMRKENENENIPRARIRVMEISNGVERNRRSKVLGSVHSSKSGMALTKAHQLRKTEKPPVVVLPRRPIRVQMAPMKRPPPDMISDDDDDDDDDEEEDEGEERMVKKGRLEVNKINDLLDRLHR